MSYYADVIVDISHEKVDKPFTYSVPKELEGSLSIGTPVMIPFGNANHLRRGYVIGLKDAVPQEKRAYKIKEIASIADRQVGIEDEFMDLAIWMKNRYGCTLNAALSAVLPVKKRIRKKKGTEYRDPLGDVSSGYRLHLPTSIQQKAIDVFKSDFSRGIRRTYLLYGVTGSGKTDVYMHMIREVIDAGKKVILLIPEIGLTYQSVNRLYSVFGNRVALVHSKLSDGERYDQFRRCMDGDADIIIGPRSAAFAPMKDIGLIVVDEEHDGAYKNENVPRYDVRDVVMERARVHGASVILASATPSPETYLNAQKGIYTLLSLPQRAVPGAKMPDVVVTDMREELKAGNRSIFSRKLDELIRDRLSRKEQTILFINRRGYSNFVSCRSCGEAIRCPHCDVSMTVHYGHKLVCHYCGYTLPVPKLCPTCGSPFIAEFGVGTQKLEQMVRAAYPQANVARMDADMTTAKHASESILKEMSEGKTDILIGTQMVVKGHDFPNVTLVGIMAAETSLYTGDYASGEKTYELITQASGRAGRASDHGCVVIQTYKPEHYAISCASRADYEGYFRQEIAYRELLKYPPAVHIWTVQLASRDEAQLEEFAQLFLKMVQDSPYSGEADIIGPAQASVYKVKDYYRKLLYVKHTNYDILLKIKDDVETPWKKARGDADISLMYDFT
jgi:primosomal protein N' (replication factor Y) (superfamily II helicase)